MNDAETTPRRGRRSSEERNEEIRAGLQPLAPGERPQPLVLAAATAALLALVNLVAFAAGVEIDGQEAQPAFVVGFCGVMAVLAVGIWARHYLAVLAFQCLLAVLVILFFLFLLRASNVTDVLIAGGIVGYAGWLFWKLIRILARIQTPPGAAG